MSGRLISLRLIAPFLVLKGREFNISTNPSEIWSKKNFLFLDDLLPLNFCQFTKYYAM